MKPTWQIRDLIDLEYFLQVDDNADDVAVAHRDRNIYLKEILPVLEKDRSSKTPNGKKIIRLWLDSRRRMAKDSPEKETILPGKLFVDIYRLLLIVVLVTGTMIGAGLAVAFLKYNGTEPVNVSTYFGAFVLFQMILLGALLIVSMLRRWIRSVGHISLVHQLFGVVLAGVFSKTAAQAMKKLSADRRNRLKAVAGLIKGRKRIYGSVFFWPLFILAQITGIGFNLGVLGGSMLKILSFDLAFGWQSTIQFSSRAVFMLVKAVALPWSWIVPPVVAHPTYLQVEGSRMVLKDGIYHLASPDLVSWWPFLLLAVLCYGLLPRMMLFVAGIMARKRATDKVNLDHAACSSLMQRLHTRILETDGRTVAEDGKTDRSADESVTAAQLAAGEAAGQWNDAIVLVPDDIFEQCNHEDLKAILKEKLSVNVKERIRVVLDFEEDKKALTDPAASQPLSDWNHIVVLQEAWLPPIAETLLYFRKLREWVGTEMKIHIFLLGKPASQTLFTGTGPADWKVWKQAIQMLGDPFVGIHGLRNL